MNVKYLKIKEPYKIDENVILAYDISKELKDRYLYIGENAVIRSGSIIYVGTRIGKNLETGHNVVIREENEIGDNFKIWNNSVVDYGCKIGNNVKIHSACYVAQFTTMEDDVFLAPGVMIANDYHPGCKYSKKCMKGPYLERGVQVGVNATLLPYVRIGAYSLVASGSVVTKDFPPYSLICGNPARKVKDVRELKCKTGINPENKPYIF